MAEPVSNSSLSSPVKITIDSENANNEAAEVTESKNGLHEKKEENYNISRTSSSTWCRDKGKDSVLKPSSFLRPSALAGGTAKPCTAFNFSSTSPKLALSDNKFACPDSTVDALFNLPASTEKRETKPPSLPNSVSVSIPVQTALSNPDYVFGQNLLARVADRSESVSNGTGSMLFSEALSEANKPTETKDSPSSLLEDAARCQEQRARKRKYEEVLVTTGEEDEKNVLQITVKLFAFEGGSWVERGRGNLRLNDASGGTGSRIVIRTMGSLRVVLNTKIWAEMELNRASDKSVTITAMDGAGQLKIFLIQASPVDMNTLYSCLEARVRRCQVEDKQRRTKTEEGSASNDSKDDISQTKTSEGSLVSNSGDQDSSRPAKDPPLDSSS